MVPMIFIRDAYDLISDAYDPIRDANDDIRDSFDVSCGSHCHTWRK